MNVFLLNRGIIRNLREISKLRKAYGDDLVLTVENRSAVSVIHLMALLSRRKSLTALRLMLPVRHLSRGIVWLCNTDPHLELTLLTDKPLTSCQWRRICALHDMVRIIDGAGEANHTRYATNRRILHSTPKNAFLEADAFFVACGLIPYDPAREIPAEVLAAAVAERDAVIARCADLSSLPLYKELAILEYLCKCR